jgi:hypothetical protein
MDILAPLTGFGVGAVVGLTGVGGGSLMTPLLLGAFGLAPALAIGTDLWFAAITKSGGAVTHWRQRTVDRPALGWMLLGSLPAALAALATLAAMAATGVGFAWALKIALGVGLLLTALVVSLPRAWAKLGLRLERVVPTSRKPALTIAAGATLGVLVTLRSIGAGAIGAALLLLLYPHMPARQLVGTDFAYAVPLALVAGIGHAALGHVNWALQGWLLVGSLPGIWLGARLARRAPDHLLRTLLAVALAAAGWKVIA